MACERFKINGKWIGRLTHFIVKKLMIKITYLTSSENRTNNDIIPVR